MEHLAQRGSPPRTPGQPADGEILAEEREARWEPPVRPGVIRSGAAHFARANPRTLVITLAALAALWALIQSTTLFPDLSDNNDEAVYLLQADALRAGHLFPPAPHNAEAFTPWLSGAFGDRFVTKYTPVYPAFIAAARLLTGSDRGALALGAAAAVLTCYALAREVLGSRKLAVVAAAFLFLSPVFLIQSGTFLAYLPTLALLQGFAAALLAGVRRESSRLIALAGLSFGLALFARPYDTLLFSLPFGVWWLAVHRRSLTLLVRRTGPLVLGLAVPVASMLAYSYEATGSALRPVFTLLEPADTIGFGERRMLPDGQYVTYGPAEAFAGVRRLLLLTGMWGFGGLALVALAAAGILHNRSSLTKLLAGVAVAVPLGYSLFWGSWASTMWGGPWRFGPLYYLPVFTPLVILAAAGLQRLRTRDPALAAWSVAGMVAVTVAMLVVAHSSHRLFWLERERLYAGPLAALAAAEDPSVVFLPPLQGPWLLQPFALARNGSFDNEVIWALDRGDEGNLEVLEEFPGRTPYRVTAEPIDSDPSLPTTLNYRTALEHMGLASAGRVTLGVEVRNTTGLPDVFLELRTLGVTRTILLDRASRQGRTYQLQLQVTPASVDLLGPRLAETMEAAPDDPGGILLSVRVAGPDEQRLVAARELALRRRGPSVEVLVPGKLVSGRPSSRALQVDTAGPGEPTTPSPGGGPSAYRGPP